jgi:hypothetical protein
MGRTRIQTIETLAGSGGFTYGILYAIGRCPFRSITLEAKSSCFAFQKIGGLVSKLRESKQHWN